MNRKPPRRRPQSLSYTLTYRSHQTCKQVLPPAAPRPRAQPPAGLAPAAQPPATFHQALSRDSSSMITLRILGSSAVRAVISLQACITVP